MDTLQRQPDGVFLGIELADRLDVEPGDDVQVLFARATQDQQLTEMKVIGLFERIPAIGALVGAGMAYFLVTVLRPLFVLRPEVVLPRADIVVLAPLVLAVSVIASLAATTLIRRLPPGELLRDE